jgi:hypothetical protein
MKMQLSKKDIWFGNGTCFAEMGTEFIVWMWIKKDGESKKGIMPITNRT